MSVRCIDAKSRKVANWVNMRSLCNELKEGVLVRRPLGTSSGQTEDTVELVEVVRCSQV